MDNYSTRGNVNPSPSCAVIQNVNDVTSRPSDSLSNFVFLESGGPHAKFSAELRSKGTNIGRAFLLSITGRESRLDHHPKTTWRAKLRRTSSAETLFVLTESRPNVSIASRGCLALDGPICCTSCTRTGDSSAPSFAFGVNSYPRAWSQPAASPCNSPTSLGASGPF